MTNEQIRLAVAEEMGWKHWDLSPQQDHAWIRPSGVTANIRDMPDCPNSLDACAEFEKALERRDRLDYLNQLWLVVNGKKDWDSASTQCLFAFVSATPLQRCEAFLRLRGKWKEDGK